MARKKEKGRANAKKGGSTTDVAVLLKKFMKTYEKHCIQTQSSVSTTIKQNLLRCIEQDKIMTKMVLSCPESCAEDAPPVCLRPLLMTIRDERYMLGKELCAWNITLNNQDIANLSIVLELRGRSSYPFTHLELLGCEIDAWSVERLGKAICFSSLAVVNLDYNEFGDEGVKGLLNGLEGNNQLVSLSLCYCKLGPSSGSLLGAFITQSAIRDLYVNGNELQCEGALDLIRQIAEYAENEAIKKLSEQHLKEPDTEVANLNMESERISIAGSGSSIKNMKRKKKGKKKKTKPPEIGPWLEKLHLADNGIDGNGEEGRTSPLTFTAMLCRIIKFSDHLMEIDLDDNCTGELCGKLILEALKERKEAKLTGLKVKVTAQISADTFSAILKNSKKLKSRKKRKKIKKKK
ncbi:uncharacterized protein LOC121323125 [Polyodon spathula]|uniref:uncharacterized protein LOC121323125 n=1 Tax=Polyodon spathula TaxID=7913 RepID=UPI001B7E676F|nr:uncharacterized protein LOC121323125 [Polyodon spathula]XP_041119861.1 uncharacterized protein LOC121323125 [Polyodon spathula]XP_041119863.1 uncharacterized protein LOC121323125 [Polyodon spathula]